MEEAFIESDDGFGDGENLWSSIRFRWGFASRAFISEKLMLTCSHFPHFGALLGKKLRGDFRKERLSQHNDCYQKWI